MVLIIYKSRETDSLIGASPSGKAPGFGPGISEVRILPPQNNRRDPFIGSLLLFYVWDENRRRSFERICVRHLCRIANRKSRLWQSHKGDTLWAWSEFKTILPPQNNKMRVESRSFCCGSLWTVLFLFLTCKFVW